MITRIWKCRWSAVRLAVAAFLLWAVVADSGARLARRQLAALPDFDHAAEVVRLREAGRFGEALVIADAGVAVTGDAETRARIEREKIATEEAQASWLRRFKDVARGAITGGAQLGGSTDEAPDVSLEVLVGAIATDLFVVGDIRDLVIQGYRYASEGEADPVIVGLSAVGIATTLAPEIDWAPSVLKAARRAGALGERLSEWLVKALRGGRMREVDSLLTDTATMARTASPAGAVRLLRHVDEPQDAARIARFLSREGRAGAGALHVTGEAGTAALRQADALRAAGKVEDAARLEVLVLKAGSKGERGASWLKAGGYRALVKPHPIVGALKGLYKGNVSALVQRVLERLDPFGWWVVPLLCAWTVFESLLLLRRLTRVPGKRAAARIGA